MHITTKMGVVKRKIWKLVIFGLILKVVNQNLQKSALELKACNFEFRLRMLDESGSKTFK